MITTTLQNQIIAQKGAVLKDGLGGFHSRGVAKIKIQNDKIFRVARIHQAWAKLGFRDHNILNFDIEF